MTVNMFKNMDNAEAIAAGTTSFSPKAMSRAA